MPLTRRHRRPPEIAEVGSSGSAPTVRPNPVPVIRRVETLARLHIAKIVIPSEQYRRSAPDTTPIQPLTSRSGAVVHSGVHGVNLDARVTLAEAAFAAKVPAGTVKNWRYRGWINHRGIRERLDVDDTGYLLRAVLRAERDTNSKPERSHRRIAA